MKKRSIITLYLYNKVNQDLEYINEFANAQQLANYFNIKNARQYVINSNEEGNYNPTHLIQDKFIAIREDIEEGELFAL